jgi:hypothetical protein
VRSLPLFGWLKTLVRLIQLYLVFASSFFSAAGLSIGAASFAGSLGGAGGAGSTGAAGAGGGGGGAGSSFLPHPTNVSVKAKSVTADNETNFFPIIDSPPFPSHSLKNLFLLSHWYRTTERDIQAGSAPIDAKPVELLRIASNRNH